MGEFDDLIDDENSVSFDDEPNETIATETEEVPETKVEEKQVVIEVENSKHDGIVPISELSSLHVEKASDVVKEGDELEFEIIKVEDEALILSKRKVDAEKAWGDLVVSFENGEIIEQGTHEELLALKGYYYNTLNAQLKENL